MISFIKSLFGNTRLTASVSKSSTPAPVQAWHSPPVNTRPAAAPAIVANAALLTRCNEISSLKTAPLPKAASSATAALSPEAVPAAHLEIPLQPIAEHLAPALRARMIRAPVRSDVFKLPLSLALEQLPRGAIRIPFGLLKLASTPGAFHPGVDLDETLVDLPLREVLSRLDATHLARRAVQRCAPVPEGMPTVFSSRHSPATPAPALPLPGKLEVSPNQHEHPGGRLTSDPRWPAVKPAVSPDQPFPAPPPRSQIKPPVPSVPPAASIGLGHPAAPSPGSPVEPEPLKVPLVSLARNWPDPMRRDILATHLSATVHLPFTELEAALKRGKVVFSWKQLRMWLSPKPTSTSSEHDAASFELPLAVLAPLFLARRSSTPKPNKTAALDDIPDVFQTRKAREPIEEPKPSTLRDSAHRETAATAPQPAPMASPVLQASLAKAATPSAAVPNQLDSLTAARSSPVPTELVQRACHLTGVAGALVATLDGLVIASQLPPKMSADMAAGFLPQIFNRIGQYTRELKLGDPMQIEMLVGNLPLQIYRTASAYFAVLGKGAEPLPKMQLSALSTQLSARTK
jgi:predicted regulator of Ras-like GTPase activity (Roadblock/LC7/MglB family)